MKLYSEHIADLEGFKSCKHGRKAFKTVRAQQDKDQERLFDVL